MAGGKRGEKVLSLGARLKYPIKITKLYKSPGDAIKRQEPILQYSFEYFMELPNKETRQLEKKRLTSITDWNAPNDGTLVAWKLAVGDELKRDSPCATVEEACTHEIQFQGLCALCGKDMNEVNWASEHRDSERAPIAMTHDQTSLTVSQLAAARAEHELQRRLLKQRKLSLVVDLDQTIIHACIEPTIGEWQQDPTNPNYDAVKDVRSFQLNDDGPRGLASGCSYYIKMRPGLVEFLRTISSMYELHVYTMGTRTYAMNIAKIVDPEQKLFGNRVISRDENGSLTAKSLQRLFPVSTNMVVIIDDRADVWPFNRHNLIKVAPYDFFKGIGDINSSFLPKRQDLIAPAPLPVLAPKIGTPAEQGTAATSTEGATAAKVSALEELASMGGGENPALLKLQAEEQERNLEKQIKDRPLLHMQEQLDKEDDEATQGGGEQSGTQPAEAPAHSRHHLLLDDDRELEFLERHLRKLHQAYYQEYDDRRRGPPQSDRKGNWDEEAEVSTVPDVGEVLDGLKEKVLRGATIVLSGLVPLGMDVEASEIGMQALSFGAALQTRINKKVTHLVISSDRPRTQKVRQAAQIPSIKIVHQNWLVDCFSEWDWLDETPYLVEVHPADRAKVSTPQEMTDAETVSDVDADDDLPAGKRNGNARLKIIVSRPSAIANDEDAEDSDDEDDGDDDNELKDPDDMSPIEELKTFDWGSADDELAEFLAEDDGDGDDGSAEGESQAGDEDEDGADETGADTDTQPPSGSKKRKHGSGGDTDTDGDASRGRGMALKKARLGKQPRSRSGLRAVRHREPTAENGSLPTPQVTGDEDEVMLLDTGASQEDAADTASKANPASLPGEADEGGEDDDELEAEMLAELEREVPENG